MFGDLKPDNLIVATASYKVRCIDVGGTTVVGRSIKEFTEFFDRGYWGLGTRKADPQYDLFAVAMIMVNAVYPTRFAKNGEGYRQLKEKVIQKKALQPYQKMIEKALLGKYASAENMRADLIDILRKPSTHSTSKNSNVKQQPQTRQTRRVQQKAKVTHKKKNRFIETFVLVAVISLLYVFYIYDQLL